MIRIPNIVPFNILKEDVVDYITTFPNSENAQPSDRLMNPKWYQKCPINTEIAFLVWTDGDTPIVTFTSGTGISTVSSTILTADGYDLYKITITFTSLGDSSFSLYDDEADLTYNSNVIKCVSSFQDEVDQWAFIEFTHNKTAFDYYFEGQDYYRLWVQIADEDDDNTSTITPYEDDGEKLTITRSEFNETLSLETSPQDRWFSKMLSNVFLCSDIKVNGIEYTPDGESSINKLEDGVYQSNVEVNLQKK